MSDGSVDEIEAILDDYHMATLLAMANAAGLHVPGTGNPRKGQVKAIMRASFFTRERVLASLGRMGRVERAVLDRLLLHGGSAPTDSLRREAVRAGLAVEAPARPRARHDNPYDYVPYALGSYTGSPYRDSSRIFDDVIARLTLHGLVFSRLAADAGPGPLPKVQFHPADTIYIPTVVLEHLPEPQPLEEPELTPATVREGDPALLLRDLYLYWDFVRRNDVPRTRAGFVSKRALRAINAQLIVPDPLLDDARSEAETGRLALLGGLLRALGLIDAQPDHVRPASDDPLHIPEFWSWPEAQEVAACLQAWLRLPDLGELPAEAMPFEPQYMHARQALVGALSGRPATGWREPEALLEQLRADDAEFLFAGRSRIRRSSGYSYGGYYNSHYYGSPETLLRSLDALEARFVDGVLTGFLALSGLVELGYEGERLVAFRLSPIGQAVLGQAAPAAAAAAEQGRVILQPNFQLVAMGPVPLATLAWLDLFAEREQADRGAFAYRLSRESVYRAQQAGMGVSEIVRFLEEAGHVELPQNVRRSLEEWAAHHQRIVFRSGVSLLQAATPELLQELLADPAMASCQARAVTPELALLAGDGQEQLVAALVARGLFPAVSGADPQSADSSVIVEADGAIRPIHAVPSLHLRGRLARLAEEGASGGGEWRLTPASVRRAGGNKARVTRLLEELSRLHRGTLPEVLVERVKAWGGYYGDAAAETLTLVEFADPEALEELLERPDLQALLTPFPAGKRALAVVPGERLAELREILAGLGVRVREGL